MINVNIKPYGDIISKDIKNLDMDANIVIIVCCYFEINLKNKIIPEVLSRNGDALWTEL